MKTNINKCAICEGEIIGSTNRIHPGIICACCTDKIWKFFDNFVGQDWGELDKISYQTLGFAGSAHGLILKYLDILYLIL